MTGDDEKSFGFQLNSTKVKTLTVSNSQYTDMLYYQFLVYRKEIETDEYKLVSSQDSKYLEVFAGYLQDKKRIIPLSYGYPLQG